MVGVWNTSPFWWRNVIQCCGGRKMLGYWVM